MKGKSLLRGTCMLVSVIRRERILFLSFDSVLESDWGSTRKKSMLWKRKLTMGFKGSAMQQMVSCH